MVGALPIRQRNRLLIIFRLMEYIVHPFTDYIIHGITVDMCAKMR